MLGNKLGITNEVELAKEEEKITKIKALELFDNIIKKYIEMNVAHPFRDENEPLVKNKLLFSN